MISVCYLIVCVNLLYCFDQAETYRRTKKPKVRKSDQDLNPLTAENQDEFLANAVSPYWNLTYSEQLDKKQRHCIVIAEAIMKRFENLRKPRICKHLQIVPSPVTKAYVNRNEFSIGRGVDGNTKTVGIIVGRRSFVRTYSIRPTKIVTIKESHKRVAQVFEDFIRTTSLPSCLKINKGGHWRRIRIRSNEEGDIMASVIVQPKGYDEETIVKHQKELKNYFLKHLPNITLFHQQCTRLRCTEETAPFVLLYGKPYLMETLSGYKFKILPDTFFSMNTLGAEVLYDNVIRTAELTPNTTVIEICSRSGEIIILASKFVTEAVGVDYIKYRVKIAKFNAEINNITNVKLLSIKFGENLRLLLKSLNTSRDIVAIVNYEDERPGVNLAILIRRCKKINRVVFISDKPDSPKDVTIIDSLCSKKLSKVHPFRLTTSIPVDVHPQTERVEIILMFQRPRHRRYLK